MQVLIHRDSKAWQLQVWVSFLIAVFLCGVGLACLPGKDLDRAFMVMGYFFCLLAAFVLAKYVRDSEKAMRDGQLADTPMFKFVVWGGFALAMALTGWGLLRMEINVRASTIIGAVGGGGIGQELKLSISRGFGAKTIALMLLLFITIFVVDQFSAWLRMRLVGDQSFNPIS